MTEAELKTIPFRWEKHRLIGFRHYSYYVNDEYGISFCVIQKLRKRTRTWYPFSVNYKFSGRYYLKYPAFLKAIELVRYRGNKSTNKQEEDARN